MNFSFFEGALCSNQTPRPGSGYSWRSLGAKALQFRLRPNSQASKTKAVRAWRHGAHFPTLWKAAPLLLREKEEEKKTRTKKKKEWHHRRTRRLHLTLAVCRRTLLEGQESHANTASGDLSYQTTPIAAGFPAAHAPRTQPPIFSVPDGLGVIRPLPIQVGTQLAKKHKSLARSPELAHQPASSAYDAVLLQETQWGTVAQFRVCAHGDASHLAQSGSTDKANGSMPPPIHWSRIH